MKRLLFVPQTLSFAILFLSIVFFSASGVRAQDGATHDDEPPKDAAPPPLKILSKEEKKLLEEETNSKKRTQLSLDLMENRLKAAETSLAENKFQQTINELGGFQALLENALNYLEQKENNNKTDYNFKRLEIGLRRTVPRLEIIRRELPYKYGFYVQKLQKYVRDARAKAVEPLFGNSVVPDN